MEIKKIGVIGAGIMGSGIAQVCAMNGFNVILQDIKSDALERSRINIKKSLEKIAAKKKIDEVDLIEILGRIQFISSLEEACKKVDLVIEAVFEDIELKHNLFRQIDVFSPNGVILASNTSALPITEIASVTNRSDKFIGIHFMNPVPVMKGVEIIRGQLTSDKTMQSVLDFVAKIGKEPIIAMDYAGFIVSRLVDVLMNEAVKLIQEGNSPEDIDKAMELCAGHPIGPCKLLDLVGAEIAMHGMETMARDFGDRYKPHPMLRKRVLAGLIGRKTGRGFYDY